MREREGDKNEGRVGEEMREGKSGEGIVWAGTRIRTEG